MALPAYQIPEGAVRPNLFIIGAQKAGTSSLHSYLARHPRVFMSEPKEPGFFVPELAYYPTTLDWYLGLFAAAGEASVIGESSTHYTKRPVFEGVPERIEAFAPEARFIYVMRDPIDRAISHYWHNARTHQEHRPLLQALREGLEYKAFGDYRYQLEPYVRRFGRERILVLSFETLTGDPGPTTASVLRWLGLGAVPDLDLAKENVRPDRVARSRGRGYLNRLRYSRIWGLLSPHVPGRAKALAKRLALEAVSPAEVPVEEAVEYLRPWARDQIAGVSEFLGCEFPEWRTSLGGSA